MPHRVETDLTVQRFGFISDDDGKRLTFPRVEGKRIEGRAGGVAYGAQDCVFDGLEGRFATLRWTADAASLGAARFKDDNGRFDMAVDRIEMSHGLMLTRAEGGYEIVSPHVTFSEMQLTLRGPFGKNGGAERPAPPSPPQTLRQDRLRFLDSLTGRIYLTVKVVLDLPVIGKRTLDQQLKIPVQEGSLDFRALDDSLDWLEGAFLDLDHESDRLALQWKVPIVGSARDLVTWKLDEEAATLASFGRVPVRSLADFRTAGSGKASTDERRKTLRSLSLEAIDIALSLIAPRSFEVGNGVIMFGGDEQPGMVDLKVTGSISDRAQGALVGTIGSVDTTIKDLQMGSARLTADRLHFDGLDQLEVVFDAFRPTRVTTIIHRVTATNLALHLGSSNS
ncbi:MAG: hypothetical protein SFX73_27230 [Kofleriaceae bacterium]|nr:hypothetical protein [Kofleriaceae bacterium]